MAFLRKKKGSPNWFGVFKDGPYNIEKSMKTTNKHEALRRLGRWATELEKSFYKRERKILFRDLAERWKQSQETPDKKKRTLHSYEERLKVHILPYFGERLVSSIKPVDIERFRVEMANKTIKVMRAKARMIDGKKVKVTEIIDGKEVNVMETADTGRFISPTTVNYTLRILSSIFDSAEQWGYSHANPAKHVKRLKQAKFNHKILSKEEMLRLLDAADGQGKVLLLFAILTGMRMGEVLAAKWENLAWEKRTYTVKESYSEFGVDRPKTDSSWRTIDLPETLIQNLREHRKNQLAEGQPNKHGLIFPGEVGEYMDPANLRHYVLYPALEKAKLPRIRFHDLRGLCATLLLESGASLKYAMNQLGHKTPMMTLGLYAGVTEEAKRAAQVNLERYVFGAGQVPVPDSASRTS